MAQTSNLTETRSTRGKLHRFVVDRLASEIIAGTYPPGSTLPVETDLCARLGVGRSSVREAMRVLVDKGMVEVRTRIGARVLGRGSWRRLDPDVVGWMLAAGPDRAFLADLVEARRIFEPAAAALAAERATGADLAGIEAGLNAMKAQIESAQTGIGLEACVAADVAFHRAILEAAGNSVLSEFEVIIEAALQATFKLSTGMVQSYARTVAAHEEVYRAIRFGQSDQARQAMLDLLNVAAEDLGIESPVVTRP